jgi:hypothetical protein
MAMVAVMARKMYILESCMLKTTLSEICIFGRYHFAYVGELLYLRCCLVDVQLCCLNATAVPNSTPVLFKSIGEKD